jgi:multisubunit Na+/H+ antiporter MnhB subunit
MVGLILVFAVYLLMRGHHEPGGGFAAGLVAGTAFALLAITEGPRKVRHAVRLAPATYATAGLSLALAAGLLPLFFSQPFFTGIWWQPAKHLALGTPMLFDTGVFLTVLGAILAVLLELEED